MEEKRHLEDNLRVVNQDNSIWAQDVERLKGAMVRDGRRNGGAGIQLPSTFRDPASTVGAPGPTSAPGPTFDTSGKYWVAGGGGGKAGLEESIEKCYKIEVNPIHTSRFKLPHIKFYQIAKS